MNRKIKNKKYAHTAQIIPINSLSDINRLLSILGKPLFYVFVLIIISLYITGYLFKTFSSNVFSLFFTGIKSFSKNLVGKKKQKKKAVKKGRESSIENIHLFKRTSFLSKKAKLLFSLKKSFFVVIISKTNHLSVHIRKLLKFAFGKIKEKKFLLVMFIFSFLCLLIVGVFGYIFILKDLPSPAVLSTRNQSFSTKIYDRNGNILYNIYKDENRTPIHLSDIPIHVRLSTIAIEDAEFYHHPGFSVKGIIRAFYKNIKEGELSGGSTITQQLVKNALLSSEKTVIRKIREIFLAVRTEMYYSKDEILQMYLNEVGYGGTAYGIQEASRMYFGKDVENLSLAEAALLAGIPKSPTLYSPFGANPQNAVKRQGEVLRLMKINSFINEKQYEEALSEEIKYAENKIQIQSPHFVMYAKEELEKKYGKEVVEKGGLSVITTLDIDIQKLAEKAVSEELEKLKKLNVTNASVVVLNPQNGDILAMVGSKDYFDIENDGNVNVSTSLRQPGSSIKVINYAYALSNKYTLASILNDSPVTFLIPNQESYTPKNYEGGYRGKITLRSALAESRNIPAVRVLNSYGVKNMIELGTKMGITTWTNPANYGLSLTLGGGDVKLIDLAYVYATLANYGKKPPLNYVVEIKNHQGKIIEDNRCLEDKSENFIAADVSASGSAMGIFKNYSQSCKSTQVIDQRVAFLLTDVLSDNIARSPSFGRNSQLVIKDHPETAVKTGTSNELRDNLTIGYTKDYVVAVWVGNNDNSPMSRIASGVTGASPIFNKIMTALLSQKESYTWIAPEGLVQLPICPYTETLACSGCPIKMEWFLTENKPEKACSQFQLQTVIQATPMPQILDEAASTRNEILITPTPILPVDKTKNRGR